MKVYQLVYISRATATFDNNALSSLLSKAKENNTKLNVTGNLVYNGGVFLQLLEGDQNTILTLFKKIETDPRHSKVKMIYFEPADFRLFTRWSMNMLNLECDKPKNLQVLKDIIDAIGEDKLLDGVSPPIKLLKEFAAIT